MSSGETACLGQGYSSPNGQSMDKNPDWLTLVVKTYCLKN